MTEAPQESDPPEPLSPGGSRTDRHRPASGLLEAVLAHEHGERIRLGDLVHRLGDRAFGALILLLSLPNVLPVPGLSTVTGLPILLLGAQMAAGRTELWLPRRLCAVSIERDAFLRVLRRAHTLIERIERRLLRPRLPALTSAAAERLVGVAVVILAAVLALPIVFANQPPAFAMALMALGLIGGDGAFVLAGLLAGVGALAIAAAVLFGFAQGLLLLLGLAA